MDNFPTSQKIVKITPVYCSCILYQSILHTSEEKLTKATALLEIFHIQSYLVLISKIKAACKSIIFQLRISN